MLHYYMILGWRPGAGRGAGPRREEEGQEGAQGRPRAGAVPAALGEGRGQRRRRQRVAARREASGGRGAPGGRGPELRPASAVAGPSRGPSRLLSLGLSPRLSLRGLPTQREVFVGGREECCRRCRCRRCHSCRRRTRAEAARTGGLRSRRPGQPCARQCRQAPSEAD